MLRKLAATAIIVMGLAGFGTSAAWAGKVNPKSACCKPSHCLSQITRVGCCRADADSKTTAPVSASSKAPEFTPALVAVADVSTQKLTFHQDSPLSWSVSATAPPLFSLKSSLLI